MYRRAINLLLSLVLLSPFSIALADVDSTLDAVDKSIRLRDYQQAVELLKALLIQDNATAQYRMAGLYRAGKGVEQDADKAKALYKKSALNGHAEAQYALASILEKQDSGSEKAHYWLEASADQGYAPASRKLKRLQNADNTLKIDRGSVFDAIRHNQINTIRKMLANGMDSNILDANQRSTLLVALNSGHKDMASLLLNHTGQIDRADKNQSRPIHVATRLGYKSIILELLAKGANINAQDLLGNTPLMIAINNKDRQLINLFLEHKANPDIQNKKQLSAIDLARDKKSLDLFERAGIDTTESIEQSSIIDIQSFEKTVRTSTSLYAGWPILSIASHLGEEALVNQLLADKTNVNARDPSGNTALHRAAANGQLPIVKKLVANGANVNATNKRKETPLFLAAASGQDSTLRYLLTTSAKTTSLTSNRGSALVVAIRNQHTRSVALLLNKPLDAESRKRALQIAIESKMETAAIKLSKNNSLLGKVDDKQRTILWLATEAGMKKLAAALIKDSNVVKTIDQQDKLGYTALARATLGNHRAIVKILIDHGASTRTVTEEKNTLLMLSAISGHAKLAEYFIRAGIDLNYTDRAGYTAIMLAAANGNDTIVDLLLTAGADLQRHNQDNLNAYQIALDAGHKKTADLIKSRSGALFNLFN